MWLAQPPNPKATITRLEEFKQASATFGYRVQGWIDPPPVPTELKYLLQIFYKIRRTVDRVTYETVAAFKNVTGINLSLCEVDLLIEIDGAWWEGRTRGN